jgi:hypothetical protein
MSLTLDATLAIAQDSQSRHPLVEIISKEWAASIPMDGQYLDTTTNPEKYPNAITLSDGSLVTVCSYVASGAGYIRYRYSDAERMYFTTVDIALGSGETINDLSLCELADGNVGIMYISTDGSYRRLKSRIVTPPGVAVGSVTTIRTFAAKTTWVSGPFVTKLADDSYLAVFSEVVTGDDPDHYHLYKYTSSNFTSWTGPTEIAPSGLDDTLYKRNPSLIQITTGQIWLWFDYTETIGPNLEELTNVYYSTSDDNGGTWSAAVKVTTYTQYSAIGKHPIAVQKVANALYMFFTEQRGSLNMDTGTTGWPADLTSCSVFNMHFDDVNRKLYCVLGRRGYGNRYLSGVVKIDVDTWTVDKHWGNNSVPAIDPEYCDHGIGSWFDNAIGSGQYVVITCSPASAQHKMACLIDGEADTIVNYYFNDMPDWGYAKNVTWSSTHSNFETISYLKNIFVDETRGRVWFHISREGTLSTKTWIGWIPLTSTSNHTATTFISSTSVMTGYQGFLNFTLKIIDEENWLMLSMFSSSDNDVWKGKLCIYDIDSAALYKSFEYDTHGDFPYYGLRSPTYYDGKIYGGFLYQSQYAQSDFRGLCILDPFSEHIAYRRPSWGSYDNYKFMWYVPMGSDNKLIISSYGYGVTIYNIASETWELFNNSTIIGLTPQECDDFVMAVYDEAAGMIYGGVGDDYTTVWTGIVAFSIYGYIRQTHYYTGVFTDDWTWTNQDNLTFGYVDYDAGIALDPDDATIYAFWERMDATEFSIKWDKEGVELSLSDFLLRGEPITCRRTINGDPARLEFAVSHGHLFDPYNNASLLSTYLMKGRKVTLRFGENVDGTEYWQAMGTFIVTEQSTSYQRGQYPTMKIVAEDRSYLWGELDIIATSEYADTDPEEIIADVLVDNTDLEETDIVLSFSTAEPLTHQWVEVDLKSIVEEIADRFGYYIRVDVDDNVAAKRVLNTNAVDHAYTDLTKLLNWTPNDSYSDFTNRVVVTGEEDTEIDVTYPEERVGGVNGFYGWQGGTKRHIVWFSHDKSRRCRDARLVVLESTSSIMFALAGEVSETLLDNSYLNADENLRYKYCVIVIDAPDLIPHLVAAMAGLVASYFIGDLVVSFFGGYTVRVGSYITAFFTWACLNILGAQGSYQYEIWAVPMGKIRRTVQGQWDDTEHQTQIAHVITKKFDDPLCHSVAACMFVAGQIGLITQLQRKRVTFEKIAHLQDEDGDTISMPHPITGQTIKIFVTDIERTMVIPEGSTNNGSFTDKIEGWVL